MGVSWGGGGGWGQHLSLLSLRTCQNWLEVWQEGRGGRARVPTKEYIQVIGVLTDLDWFPVATD